MSTAQQISLQQITIASPCTVDWNTMQGDHQVRHCQLCQNNVYNVANMNEADVTTLLNQHESKPCLRIYRRADNTIVTLDNCHLFTPTLSPFPVKGFMPFAMGLLLAGCMHQPTHPAIYFPILPTAGVPDLSSLIIPEKKTIDIEKQTVTPAVVKPTPSLSSEEHHASAVTSQRKHQKPKKQL